MKYDPNNIVTVNLKLESTKEPDYLNLQVAVNCTEDEAVDFFNSCPDEKLALLISIHCGVSIDGIPDHKSVLDRVAAKDNAIVAERSYCFTDNGVSNCLVAVQDSIKTYTHMHARIDSVKMGSLT